MRPCSVIELVDMFATQRKYENGIGVSLAGYRGAEGTFACIFTAKKRAL
jgi:hypothetical protein